MASTTINPTRMELARLKTRLKTASRGHKLLKDKRDELMRQLLDLAQECRELRNRMEAGSQQANIGFAMASAAMGPQMLGQSLMYPAQRLDVRVNLRNVVGVTVPEFSFDTHRGDLPYGFAQTTAELDLAMESLSGTLTLMLELAQKEKTLQLLAHEIESTRRRVNALEYIMIPDLESKIRYISMRLEENQRSTTARLMKVKDMMLNQGRDNV